MEAIVRPDADQAIALGAALLEARPRARSTLVLGLASGRTMARVYGALMEGDASFKGVTTFIPDESIGPVPDDPTSHRPTVQ